MSFVVGEHRENCLGIAAGLIGKPGNVSTGLSDPFLAFALAESAASPESPSLSSSSDSIEESEIRFRLSFASLASFFFTLSAVFSSFISPEEDDFLRFFSFVLSFSAFNPEALPPLNSFFLDYFFFGFDTKLLG